MKARIGNPNSIYLLPYKDRGAYRNSLCKRFGIYGVKVRRRMASRLLEMLWNCKDDEARALLIFGVEGRL